MSHNPLSMLWEMRSLCLEPPRHPLISGGQDLLPSLADTLRESGEKLEHLTAAQQLWTQRLRLRGASWTSPEGTDQKLGIFIEAGSWRSADVLTSWMDEVKDEQRLQCQVKGDSMHSPTH
ncbi:hypothetical protein Mapa_010998 [Marchantia paleacea]|nr:hypothetical protein Mapa_010998 [Marchantia paleacea]